MESEIYSYENDITSTEYKNKIYEDLYKPIMKNYLNKKFKNNNKSNNVTNIYNINSKITTDSKNQQ
jgi:hypothetical protein